MIQKGGERPYCAGQSRLQSISTVLCLTLLIKRMKCFLIPDMDRRICMFRSRSCLVPDIVLLDTESHTGLQDTNSQSLLTHLYLTQPHPYVLGVFTFHFRRVTYLPIYN
jgi:hypothetical protein